MKAAVLHGIKNLKIENVKFPKIKKGEVLIKLIYSLTCGTDLKTYERGHAYINYPMIIGHEYVGEIIKIGEKVKKFKIGDIVTGVNSAPCNSCFYCNKRNFNLCENLKETLIGFTVPGSFAEYMIIPSRIVKQNLFKVEGNKLKNYASLEPLSCIVHGMRKLKIKKDDKILIIGSGPIALLFAQVLSLKTKNILIIGKHENRIKIAKELGFNVVNFHEKDFKEKALEFTKNYGFDFVIEAVGSLEAWELSIEFIRKAGSILYFGGLKEKTKICIDSYKIHYEEVKILGSFHHDPLSVKYAFNLIKENKINIEKIITSERNLEEVENALIDMSKGKEMKVCIKFD